MAQEQATRIKSPRPPRDAAALAGFCQRTFGIRVPTRGVVAGHAAPADYLYHSIFGGGDCVVWSCRGGGKTLMAALAAVMELYYGVCRESAIIGGSQLQSTRVLAHAKEFALRLWDDVEATAKAVRAGAGIIHAFPQSEKAVRGLHVPKIRLDEVELFDEEVFRAVALSTTGDKKAGSMDYLSTAHVVGGRMQGLITGCGAGGGKARLFHWGLWDIIERCEGRCCEDCPLKADCGGLAREAEGFYRVEDAAGALFRASRATWESEMLCLGPRKVDCVFPEFSLAANVAPVRCDPALKVHRAIDFGFTGMFVCLWFQRQPDGGVLVLDEYARARVPLEVHAREILARTDVCSGAVRPCREEALTGPLRTGHTYGDPAGNQVSQITGRSAFQHLTDCGIHVHGVPHRVQTGLEILRSLISPACGGTRLKIHPRCTGLIEAFSQYQYGGEGSTPVKDGPDHWIDALRYGVVGSMNGASQWKRY